MRHLRELHQAIGRLVASPGGLDAEAAAELERLLGPDALSILAEIVIYRVVAVGRGNHGQQDNLVCRFTGR